MAYALLDSSSQSLTTTSSPLTAAPITIACWCRPTANQSMAIAAVGVSGGSDRHQLQVQSGPVIACFSQGSVAGVRADGPSITTNSWTHAAAVIASSTSRIPYANGVAGTTSTINCGTVGTLNSIVIGGRWNVTLGAYFKGDIADFGVWNTDLTAAEVASLAAGVSCRLIRPQSLVFYAPLIRDLIDVRGGLTITNNNTATVANHPRVYA